MGSLKGEKDWQELDKELSYIVYQRTTKSRLWFVGRSESRMEIRQKGWGAQIDWLGRAILTRMSVRFGTNQIWWMGLHEVRWIPWSTMNSSAEDSTERIPHTRKRLCPWIPKLYNSMTVNSISNTHNNVHLVIWIIYVWITYV